MRLGPAMMLVALAIGCGKGGGSADLEEVDAGSSSRPRARTWSTAATDGPVPTLHAIHGFENTAVAVGDSGAVLTWNGTRWSRAAQPLPIDLAAVAVVGPSEWWATGGGRVFRSLGGALSEVSDGLSGEPLHALLAAQPDGLWAAGDDGTLVIWEHGVGRWTAIEGTVPFRSLRGLWGRGSDGWAVGDGGAVVRIQRTAAGLRGNAYVAPAATRLNAVWGSGPTDVWAVGEGGLILRFDGSVWRQALTPIEAINWELRAVWGLRPDDVWAVGAGDQVLRWDGEEWKLGAVPSPRLTANLYGLWGSEPGGLWAVGEGVLLLLPALAPGTTP